MTLDATPMSVTSRKGGSSPAHVWHERAVAGYQCEGLNPLDPPERRKFAEQHLGHIEHGERFLRKAWVKSDQVTEFHTRHCKACGEELERQAGVKRTNGNGAA